jgi:hypothetical protein
VPDYYYWPPTIPRTETLQSFVAAFHTLGYGACDSGELERGFEKIAIFAGPLGTPTHAARQLSSGGWVSKLGNDEDINHTIYGLEGGPYGNVVQYMKRPLSI